MDGLSTEEEFSTEFVLVNENIIIRITSSQANTKKPGFLKKQPFLQLEATVSNLADHQH